jgi:hypothetical protein
MTTGMRGRGSPGGGAKAAIHYGLESALGSHPLRCPMQREPGDWKCVFLPPFFLMDGIVLAKGLGGPSRTFFE